MKLTVLGSGTYTPQKGRTCSSFLVEEAQANIVIDFGRGVLESILCAGLGYWKIQNILITHTHADHVSDLPSLLHITLHPSRSSPGRKAPLGIFGPATITGFYSKMCALYGFSQSDSVSVQAAGRVFSLGKLKVESFPVDHGPSLAYRVTGRKTVAFSGDTGYCENLVKAMQNADIAVAEASHFPEKKGHLTGELAGKAAAEANAKTLLLTHISPYYSPRQAKRDAARHFRGKIIVAKQGMRLQHYL